MSTTLDMERIAKELGAERREKVSASGGYFGALQLAAEVAAHSCVSEGPPSPNEIIRKGNNLMYDHNAQQELLNKLDYELWLLDQLAEYQLFDGGTDIATLKIRIDEPETDIWDLDSGTLLFVPREVITAITPLVFTASYKMLDIIFEWILEENLRVGQIEKVPWGFQDKLKLLKSNPNLQYPPLFATQKYLHSYSEALFHRLLPYRNEIVHNNAFSVSKDKDNLILSSSKNEKIGLTLSRAQVGCLIRFVVALSRALAGVIKVDAHRDRLLKYHLDSLATAHGLKAFKQQKPLLVNVELEMSKRCGSFPVNLKQIRDRVSTTFQDVCFNLTVRVVDGGNLIAKWYFEEEDVPTLDEVTFDEGSYKAHRVD